MLFSSSEKPQILIVNDSAANRDLFVEMLQGEYPILLADGGEEALEILRSPHSAIALVLLELIMPKLDGFGVLGQMQQMDLLDSIPVIATSATNDPESVRRAYEMGVTDFLCTNTDAVVFRKRISNAIRLYARQKINFNQVVSLAEQLEKENRRQESVDELTGCNNHSSFFREAERILRANIHDTYALCYCNIKQFKLINNRFGYNIGDYVLRFWATQIQLGMMPEETFGRMSGDHFLVLIKFQSFEQLDERFQERGKSILHCLRDLNIDYEIEIVAGVYLIQPGDIDSLNLNIMMDRANLAQQNIKRKNGSSWGLYDEKMLESQMRRAEISKHLTDALHSGEISVYFQPQYDFARQVISGAEALCRWEHRTLGWLSPAEFIPVLEQTNQILELDNFVWRRACHVLSQLRAQGIHIPLSVNISRSDISEENLVDTFVHLIQEYNLFPEDLHLEVTESAFMDDSALLNDVVAQLRSQGFLVEMDDFGSGYSSLTMLKSLPIDLLKLDCGFVREAISDKRGNVILYSVVEMARKLGLPIIAEGIETLEQAQQLMGMSCRWMQGYYFAHPMSEKDFMLHLKQLPSDAPTHTVRPDGSLPERTASDEHELENARRAELETTALLRQIVDASNCGIFAYTIPQRRVVIANREAYRLMGWQNSEVVLGLSPYVKLTKQIVPKDRNAIRAAVQNMKKPGDSITVTYRLQKARKPYMKVQLTSKLLQVPTGELMILSTLVDITDKAQAVDSLAASLQTFHIASRETGESVFVFDTETRTVNVESNQNCLFSNGPVVEGVPYDTVNNGTVEDCSKQDYIEMYQKMIDGASSASAILHRITADGRRMVAQVNLQAVLDAEGKPTSKVVGVITDITTQYKQRQAIADMAANSKDAQQKLRRHQEVIHALASDYFAIYLVHVDDDHIDIIRTSDTLLPQVAEHIRKKPAFQDALAYYVEHYVYSKDQERLLHDFSADVLRRRLRQEGIFFLRYRRISGDIVQYAEFKMVDVSDAHDGSRAVMAVRNVDSAVRRELHQQEQLKDALAQAQYANLSKARFLSSMSHDIRTPINAIIGYSSIASKHVQDPQRVSECIQKVLLSGGKLQDLITDILDMAQLETGAPKIRCEPVSLTKTLKGPLNITQSKASAKHQLLAVNLSSLTDDNVSADGPKLNQVLMSILDNAVKYTPQGGCIRFTATQEDASAPDRHIYSFQVEDNGIGMSEEFLQHLFEPFERENSYPIRMEGIGLGMAIAKRISDAMGAEILVQSKQGIGTCVTVRLELPNVPLPKAAESAGSDVPVTADARILLVEDNSLNREIALELLLEAGFAVDTAENGVVALEMLEQSPAEYYTLVLMNPMLPMIDGCETTKAIRNSNRKDISKLPILSLTSNTLSEDREKAIESSIGDHLFKPIDPEELIQEIKRRLK